MPDCEFIILLTMTDSSHCFDNETGCFNFSKEYANAIFDVKAVLGSFGILLSLFATGLIIWLKAYKKFVYRLVMYLMAVNITRALCILMELIPLEVTNKDCVKIRNGTGWTEVCAVLGYLDIVTAWMGNIACHHLDHGLHAQAKLATSSSTV